jgi:hypothetical protein
MSANFPQPNSPTADELVWKIMTLIVPDSNLVLLLG